LISILIASRGRPERLKLAVEAIRDTQRFDNEIILGLDSDDVKYPDLNCRVFTFDGLGASEKWYQIQKHATKDYLFAMGDDQICITKDWDEKYISYMPEDGIAAVIHRDDPSKHRGATGAMVSSRWHKEIEYFPPHFWHFYADTWICEIAESIGRMVFADDVVIDHRHAKFGKSEWDETYNRRTKPQKRIWESTRRERIEKAEKLKALLNTPWIK